MLLLACFRSSLDSLDSSRQPKAGDFVDAAVGLNSTICLSRDFDDSNDSGVDDDGGLDVRTVSSVSRCRQRRQSSDSSSSVTMAAAYDYVLNYSYLDCASASATNVH